MKVLTKNDVFYVASLIEFIARKTKNSCRTIAETIGVEGFQRLLEYADLNHCLSFEQVSDEVIADYGISTGDVDTVGVCKYKVPSCTAIGKVYMRLVTKLTEDPEKWAETLYQVFCSKTSEAISDFNSSFFFAPSGEILYYHKKWIEKGA